MTTHEDQYAMIVWRNGGVEIVPPADEGGAITVATGSLHPLEKARVVKARHGYEKGVYLCPGVPEADSDEQALEALEAFADQVQEYLTRE